MALSLPEHLAAQEATGHGGVSAARFRKATQKYETTSLQVTAGIYRVFRNHENEKNTVLPRH